MSARRRVSLEAERQASPASSDEALSSRRSATVKISRNRPTLSSRRSTKTSALKARTRRSTPMVRSTRTPRPGALDDVSDEESEISYNDDGRRLRATVSTNRSDGLAWYERLIPDFFLNMTAPVTGYENRLESDVEEDEYEILERQRLKRNRRIRRRLFALVAVAAAATAFFYYRGKLPKKSGVQAAMSSMAHRLESGISKKMHDL